MKKNGDLSSKTFGLLKWQENKRKWALRRLIKKDKLLARISWIAAFLESLQWSDLFFWGHLAIIWFIWEKWASCLINTHHFLPSLPMGRCHPQQTDCFLRSQDSWHRKFHKVVRLKAYRMGWTVKFVGLNFSIWAVPKLEVAGQHWQCQGDCFALNFKLELLIWTESFFLWLGNTLHWEVYCW